MVDTELIEALDIVESVKRITEPYKNANRKFHPKDTVIEVGSVKLGGGHFAVIAGPCSIESMDQVCSIAEDVKKAGALLYRGGAFKPRTSPYAFQGMVRPLKLSSLMPSMAGRWSPYRTTTVC